MWYIIGQILGIVAGFLGFLNHQVKTAFGTYGNACLRCLRFAYWQRYDNGINRSCYFQIRY